MSSTRTSLELALAEAERFWGATWYWNPARWATPDGYVPWPVFRVAYDAMEALLARRAIAAMNAAAYAHLPPESQRDLMARLQTAAFPEA